MNTSGRRPRTPRWAWPIALLGAASSLLTLDGILPAAIGGASAGVCIGIARQHRLSVGSRLTACGLAVSTAWIVIALLWGPLLDDDGHTPATDGGLASDEDQYNLREPSGRQRLYLRLLPYQQQVQKAARELADAQKDGFAIDVYAQRLDESKQKYDRILGLTAQMLHVDHTELERLMAQDDQMDTDSGAAID